jgi:Alpha amylase, catalytic domain
MKLRALLSLCVLTTVTYNAVAQKDASSNKEQLMLATRPVEVRPDQQTLYEVNVRQFSDAGNFAGVTARLGEIRRMGVTTLWLMPIYPIGKEKRKGTLGSYYSIKNYTDVNPEFGNTDDFKKLVDGAHKVGMKVIIDWVANHTAWDHAWVKQNPEYYEKEKSGKIKSPFDWTDVAELDYNNKVMSAQMIEAMRFWVANFGIDGFRCDVADMVPLDFWKAARNSIDPKMQQLWLAECENPEYFKVFDLQYAWKWMHMLEDISKGKATIDSMNKISKYYFDLANEGKHHLFFTSNHDENSWNGTEYEKFGAQATPFGHLSALMPGAFLIYNGQECAFNRRLKFFEKDPIAWEKSLLAEWYRSLSDLNKDYTLRETMGTFVRSQEVGSLAMILHPFKKELKNIADNEVSIVLLNGSEKEQNITVKEKDFSIDYGQDLKPLQARQVMILPCGVKQKDK